MRRRWPSFLALGLLWAYLAGASLWWLTRSVRSPGWDEAVHMLASFELHDAVRELRWPARAAWLDPRYPPLFPAASLPLYAVFGLGLVPATMTNAIFLAVLLAATFAIGRELHGPAAGLLAAYLAAVYPISILMALEYWLDFAAMAMTAAAVAALVRARASGSRRAYLGAGLVLGLALLTRHYTVIFVAGPLAVLAASDLRRLEGRWRQALGRLLAFGAGTLAGCGFYYVPTAVAFFTFLPTHFATRDRIGAGPALWNMIRQLPGIQMGTLFALLLAFALMLVAARRQGRRHELALAWLLAPFAVFVLIPRRDARYLMCVLPAAALITGAALTGIRGLWRRRLLIGAVTAAGLLQHALLLGLIYPDGVQVGKLILTRPARVVRRSLKPVDPGLRCLPLFPEAIDKRDWRLDDVAEAFMFLAWQHGRPWPRVLLTGNSIRFNETSLRVHVRLLDLPVELWSLDEKLEMTLAAQDSPDMVVVGPRHLHGAAAARQLLDFQQDFRRSLVAGAQSREKIEVPLAMGQTATIYYVGP